MHLSGSDATPSVSLAVQALRKILIENTQKNNIIGEVSNGTFPLVVHVENKYDIMQMIQLKKDFPSVRLIIFGAAEAHLLAKEISQAQIPLIVTHNRGGPATFETKDLLVGPPLTRSAISVLADANVTLGIAIFDNQGDSTIFKLPMEAKYAAKFARLSDQAAINLVSKNIESILGIHNPDMVLWEGNPLTMSGSVAASFDGETGEIATCWPVTN